MEFSAFDLMAAYRLVDAKVRNGLLPEKNLILADLELLLAEEGYILAADKWVLLTDLALIRGIPVSDDKIGIPKKYSEK